MTSTGYCIINGNVCTTKVTDVQHSGGELKLDEDTIPGLPYASVHDQGRGARSYLFKARFFNKDDLEAWLEAVNAAPEDAAFAPYEAGRYGFIARASAKVSGAERSPAINDYVYRAEAKITTKENWLYGNAQGLTYATNVLLPASKALTNNGHKESGLDYLQVSGTWVYWAGAWSSLKTYGVNSAVSNDGHYYIAKKAVPKGMAYRPATGSKSTLYWSLSPTSFAASQYTQSIYFQLVPSTSDVEPDPAIIFCSKLMIDDYFKIDRWGAVPAPLSGEYVKILDEPGEQCS